MLPKLHAEISCINQIKHLNINFSKVKLYIYRIGKTKDIPYRMSRPCPSCMAAIRDIGIRHVYYTTDLGYAYEQIEKNIERGVA